MGQILLRAAAQQIERATGLASGDEVVSPAREFD
jgi:hypothetical protein